MNYLMELILFWTGAVCSLFLLHHLIIPKTKYAGSDESFHIYCIKKIQWNGHKFFKNSPEFAFPDWKYPLLYHWCLSFFPLQMVRENSRKVALIVDVISYLACFMVLITIVTKQPDFITYCLLTVLFVFNPNAMNFANARNAGLSARGFGSIFVVLAFGFLWMFSATDEWIYFFLSSSMFALVLLSSEMGIQASLLGVGILSIIDMDFYLLLVTPTAYFLANIISGGYAGMTVQYKRDHLHIYRKYLAAIFILDKRESIWLDWVKIIIIINDKGLLKSGKYYWTSPLVNLLIDFPLNLLVLITFLDNPHSALANPFFSLALLPLILFIATSFRLTRFLGEPERYSEYFQIFSLAYLLQSGIQDSVIYIVVGLVLLRIIGNAFLFRFSQKTEEQNRINLVSYMSRGDIVAANNLELTKSLLGELPEDKFYSVFYGGITKEIVYGIPFDQLYTTYPLLRTDALMSLINKTNANVCLVDSPEKNNELLGLLSQLNFINVYESNNLHILRREV